MRLFLSKSVQTQTRRDLPPSKRKTAPIATIYLFAKEANHLLHNSIDKTVAIFFTIGI